MKRLARTLLIIVLLELLATAGLVAWRLTRPQPPQPNLALVDSLTAADFRELQHQVCWDTANAWRELAEAYTVFGFFPEADLCCRRAAELDPDSFDTFYLWGMVLDRLGRTSESIDTFRQSIEFANAEKSEVCWHHIGRNYLREEKLADAEAAFRKAGSRQFASHELAKLLIRSERADQAVPLLDNLIADHSDIHNHYQLRARAARALGDRRAAADYRDRAERAPISMETDPIIEHLHSRTRHYGVFRRIQEGDALASSGQIDKAAARFLEITQIKWLPLLVRDLVSIELQLGHADQAIQLLDEQIARDSPNKAPLDALGDAYDQIGNADKARECWERVVQIGPESQTHRKLAESYSRRGNEQQARRHTGLAHYADGLAAFRNNELPSAVIAFKKAVSSAPQHAHSWFYLAESQRFLGHVKQARNAYHRCLKINPNHGRAIVGLDRLTDSH